MKKSCLLPLILIFLIGVGIYYRVRTLDKKSRPIDDEYGIFWYRQFNRYPDSTTSPYELGSSEDSIWKLDSTSYIQEELKKYPHLKNNPYPISNTKYQ